VHGIPGSVTPFSGLVAPLWTRSVHNDPIKWLSRSRDEKSPRRGLAMVESV